VVHRQYTSKLWHNTPRNKYDRRDEVFMALLPDCSGEAYVFATIAA
jgi:hypothetical protein